MSAHDFEKNVQDQMTEFNLTPSENAWANVELQLKKDKRRRRIIIWIPLFMLMGFGGYFLYNHQHSSESISISSPKENTIPAKEDKGKETAKDHSPKEQIVAANESEESLKDEKEPGNSGSEIKENKLQKNEPLEKSASIAKKSQKEAAFEKIVNPSRIAEKHENSISTSGKSKETRNKKLDRESIVLSNKTKSVEDSKLLMDEPEKEWRSSKVNGTKLLFEGPSIPVSINSAPISTMPLVSSAKPYIAAPTIKKQNANSSSKWQWGANIGIGVSRVSTGDFFSGLTAARVADANYSGSVSSTPPSGSGNSQPAAINAGSSLQLGIFAERKINPRLGLSAGLQYGNYSTRSTIGTAIDSQVIISNSSTRSLAVDNFYTSGAATNYKSRYHFLELPVNLNIQLNKASKIPFIWSVGFTYSYMLSTTALQFDGVSRVYYEDDKLFRKSQWYWQTGLSIGLLSKSKHPINIGPRLQYNTTSLLQNTSSGNNHLWGGSLQLKWMLKK